MLFQKFWWNNRTLYLTLGARRSHGQTISADISLFSLPYQVGLYTQWNLKPKLVVLVFSSSQILQYPFTQILPMPNLPFAELCRFPRIYRELHDGCFSLLFLLDTSISNYVDTSDPTPNLPFADLCRPVSANMLILDRFRRNEKKLSPLVKIGSLMGNESQEWGMGNRKWRMGNWE